MGYDWPVYDAPSASGSQRVTEGEIVPGAHPTLFRSNSVYKDGVRGQASNQPTANYPPEHPPQWAAGNSDACFLENEENVNVSHAAGVSIPTLLLVVDTPAPQGSASLCLLSSVTHSNPLSPTVEAHNARNRLGGEQETHDNITQMAHSVASPNRTTPSVTAPLEGVGQHPVRSFTTYVPIPLTRTSSTLVRTEVGTAAPMNGKILEARRPAIRHTTSGNPL